MSVTGTARIAVLDATKELHLGLRRRYGLAPSNGRNGTQSDDVAYVGREFRVYTFMRIGEAARFYGALHSRWDGAALAKDFAALGIDPNFEVKRLKSTYQRALVLALALARRPKSLVVECAEEFDEPKTRALLENALGRTSLSIATFEDASTLEADWFDRTVAAGAFDAAGFAP